jgi:hypothetical protein
VHEKKHQFKADKYGKKPTNSCGETGEAEKENDQIENFIQI